MTDNYEEIGRRLIDRLVTLTSERDFVEFARCIHPDDLAEIKNLILKLLDAESQDALARALYNQLEIELERDQLVESDGTDIAAAYLANVVYAAEQEEDGSVQPTELAPQYVGTVVEAPNDGSPTDSTILHILHLPGEWPQVASFQHFEDEWRILFSEEVAKLSLQVREVESRIEHGDSRDYVQAIMNSELQELIIIGYRKVTEQLAAVMTHIETSLSSKYGVFSISHDDPAWQLLDEKELLLVELIKKYDLSNHALKQSFQAMMTSLSQLESMG